MAAITGYLEQKLKLRVNHDKSAVARPWARKFLGYSFAWHKQARLKIADSSLQRLKDKVRDIVVGNVSRNLAATINELNPVLRGWTSYFRLTEVKGVLKELDGWIRRKLRCLLWRQWKYPATRNRKLQGRGLDGTRAWKSASNGRGPWWNAGASCAPRPGRWRCASTGATFAGAVGRCRTACRRRVPAQAVGRSPRAGAAASFLSCVCYFSAGLSQAALEPTEYSAPGALRVFWNASSVWPRMAA